MIHNFKYIFKVLLRSRSLIFWTFAFPIILGTFFYMAFSNIENSEKLKVIDIAIVNNEEWQSDLIIKEAFAYLGDKNSKDQLFNITYTTKAKADELLDEKIDGYILIESGQPKIVVSTSGVNQTIIKMALEEIMQTKEIIATFIKENEHGSMKNQSEQNYAAIYQSVLMTMQNMGVMIKDTSSGNLSYTMIEFYTLIAMTCLYGGILGMIAINMNLANMTSKGKRISVSPVPKTNLIIGSVLASYLIQLIGLALVFGYTVLVLKVDYGPNLPLIVLLALAGSLAGLALGVAVGALVKANDNAKLGIVIAITMAGCFLSGMMGITMKYLVDNNIPFLNMINPASMITDGFYSLYYYDTYNRFIFDFISLIIFAALLLFLAVIGLRRQKYDSI